MRWVVTWCCIHKKRLSVSTPKVWDSHVLQICISLLPKGLNFAFAWWDVKPLNGNGQNLPNQPLPFILVLFFPRVLSALQGGNFSHSPRNGPFVYHLSRCRRTWRRCRRGPSPAAGGRGSQDSLQSLPAHRRTCRWTHCKDNIEKQLKNFQTFSPFLQWSGKDLAGGGVAGQSQDLGSCMGPRKSVQSTLSPLYNTQCGQPSWFTYCTPGTFFFWRVVQALCSKHIKPTEVFPSFRKHTQKIGIVETLNWDSIFSPPLNNGPDTFWPFLAESATIFFLLFCILRKSHKDCLFHETSETGVPIKA